MNKSENNQIDYFYHIHDFHPSTRDVYDKVKRDLVPA